MFRTQIYANMENEDCVQNGNKDSNHQPRCACVYTNDKTIVFFAQIDCENPVRGLLFKTVSNVLKSARAPTAYVSTTPF